MNIAELLAVPLVVRSDIILAGHLLQAASKKAFAFESEATVPHAACGFVISVTSPFFW
jgi:hypothetical protein